VSIETKTLLFNAAPLFAIALAYGVLSVLIVPPIWRSRATATASDVALGTILPSLAVLAAVLAVLGYSVNESVVIFDRIRENFRRYRKMNTTEIIDNAITSTISRTIITHGSTQIMVLSMLLFGGPTLFYFALALTIGILFGIYSSVFVAAAIAMWLGIRREDLIKGPAKKDEDPNDPNAGATV
jgi:preprotein translocase subunit SecF